MLCSGSAIIGGPLYLAGVNIADAIANASSTIDTTSQLALASVTASGDVSARDVIASRDLAASGELHCDGPTQLNGTLTVTGASTVQGCRVAGGQGRNGTGASLRVTGAGDLVYNTRALYFGGNSVDTQNSNFRGKDTTILCEETQLCLGHIPWE